MTRGAGHAGYTIVETMIFLAVTGVLFASAASVFAGKHATVQFNQAARDAQSKVEDIINQISSGYYPHNGQFTCSADPNTNTPPTFTATPLEQGASSSCIFLGKVVQFGQGTDGDEFSIFSVTGRRLTPSNDDVQKLSQAKPTAISPVNAAEKATGTKPDITEKGSFQYGLKVTRITTPNASGSYTGKNYGAVVLFTSFPAAVADDPTILSSGSQVVNHGVLPTSNLGDDQFTAVANINQITETGSNATVLSPDSSLSKGIVICLSDDGGSRKAQLTIGGAVGGSSVNLDMGSTAVCP